MAICTRDQHRLWPKGDRAECIDCGRHAVRLIDCGWALTTPAGEAQPGQRWVFNYGATYDVLRVERDGLWVHITARNPRDGQEYTLRKRATTPIVLWDGAACESSPSTTPAGGAASAAASP